VNHWRVRYVRVAKNSIGATVHQGSSGFAQENTTVAMTPKGWKNTDMKNSPERAATSNDIVIRDR
jgi:hypothetical protein